VASHASCPVVVVPPDASPRPRGHVVVGVDGSPLSAEAVGYAYLQAAERGTGLTVVHAWQVDPIEESIRYAASDAFWSERSDPEKVVTAESLAGWAEKYPDVVVRRRVVRSAAVEAIVAESEGAGLVVVGSRGWGDVRGALLGSVSQGCLRRVHGPVAVVRPRAAAGAR
jgi:nucleotide-binding universal stress UspA family protein